MGMWLTSEVMAIFVSFWPILPKIWLSWQHPSDLCNQKCRHWIGQSRKRPQTSNRILVIYHTNAFICIYSYFSPKIGLHCIVISRCPLYMGVSQVNSPIAQTKSENQTFAWICRLHLLRPKFGCHGNVP